MANPFTYCELHAANHGKAGKFYGALFDWKTTPEDVPGHAYSSIDTGAGFPGGMTERHLEGVSGWLTYVQVEDCAASTRRARELGAQVLRELVEIPEGTFSVLRDPDGNALGLFEKRK